MVGGSEHDVAIVKVVDAQLLVVDYDGVPFELFLGEKEIQPRLALIDGMPLTIEVESSRPGNYSLKVNKKIIQVSFSRPGGADSAETNRLTLPVTASQSLEKGGRVTAHMPGRIVSVKVKPSDRVEVGDPIFVLVAMKMENTLVAPRAGIIIDVYVQVGATVNKGDLLALIE